MKKKKILLFLIISVILFTPTVYAANPYCTGLKSTFKFIGEIVRLAKIIIPLVIIAFGMMDLFKAVVGSKDGEITKSLKALVFRLVAGVCVFFLPTIVEFVFSWVDGWTNDYENSYQECATCILNVRNCD